LGCEITEDAYLDLCWQHGHHQRHDARFAHRSLAGQKGDLEKFCPVGSISDAGAVQATPEHEQEELQLQARHES
jgi:hypothetical protein